MGCRAVIASDEDKSKKRFNISYEEAASKFKFAMYTQKIADVISLYYGVKGVGIVNGKISAVDLAKAEKAINEYNALKQELNAGKGTTATTGKQEAIIPNNNWEA